jgi:hypothetical protein
VEGFYVGNEFAEIKVELDDDANGLRLKLTDVRSGQVRRFDALELETLLWLRPERIELMLDPSFDRWADRENPGG